MVYQELLIFPDQTFLFHHSCDKKHYLLGKLISIIEIFKEMVTKNIEYCFVHQTILSIVYKLNIKQPKHDFATTQNPLNPLGLIFPQPRKRTGHSIIKWGTVNLRKGLLSVKKSISVLP